jgi:hypothetical protein
MLVGLIAATPAMAQGSAEQQDTASMLAEAPSPDSEAQELAEAPSPDGEAEELAKRLANPVARLIGVPLQENIDFGGGPGDTGFKSTLNLQPVMPISRGKMNLILRTILPVIYQKDLAVPNTDQGGLGDTTQDFFFSPVTKPGEVIWAIGPVAYYPGERSPHGRRQMGRGHHRARAQAGRTAHLRRGLQPVPVGRGGRQSARIHHPVRAAVLQPFEQAWPDHRRQFRSDL